MRCSKDDLQQAICCVSDYQVCSDEPHPRSSSPHLDYLLMIISLRTGGGDTSLLMIQQKINKWRQLLRRDRQICNCQVKAHFQCYRIIVCRDGHYIYNVYVRTSSMVRLSMTRLSMTVNCGALDFRQLLNQCNTGTF